MAETKSSKRRRGRRTKGEANKSGNNPMGGSQQ